MLPLWQFAKRHPVLVSIALLCLCKLAIALIMLQKYLAQYGYVVLSADDTTRGALAYTFWHHPFFYPPSHFLPMHSYITGFFIGLMYDIHSACITTSLLFSLVMVALSFLVGRKLAGNLGGWLSALMLLMEPFPFYVGLSGGLTDTIFYSFILAGMLIILHLVERPRLIWLGALIFLLATMTRYEAFAYATVFAGVVVWLVIKKKVKWWVGLIALAIIPSYHLGLLLKTYLETGNPLAIVTNYADGMYTDSRVLLADTMLDHLIFPFKVLWQDNSLLVWTLPFVLVWSFWGKKRTALGMTYVLVGFALLFYIVQSKGAGFAPNRYFAQVLVLTHPLIAALLIDICKKLKTILKNNPALGYIPCLLILPLLYHDYTAIRILRPSYSYAGVGIPDNTRVTGKLLEKFWAEGLINPDLPVWVEQKAVEMYGMPYFSNHPDRFEVYCIEPIVAGSGEDGTLGFLNYELGTGRAGAAFILSDEMIDRYLAMMDTFDDLDYSFRFDFEGSKLLMILPRSFSLKTSLTKKDSDHSEKQYKGTGKDIPLDAILAENPQGTGLVGDLSYISSGNNSTVIASRPIALILPVWGVPLETRAADTWLCNNQPLSAEELRDGIRISRGDEIVMETWISVNQNEFLTMALTTAFKIIDKEKKTNVEIVIELTNDGPIRKPYDGVIISFGEHRKEKRNNPNNYNVLALPYPEEGQFTLKGRFKDMLGLLASGVEFENVRLIHIALKVKGEASNAGSTLFPGGMRLATAGEE